MVLRYINQNVYCYQYTRCNIDVLRVRIFLSIGVSTSGEMLVDLQSLLESCFLP